MWGVVAAQASGPVVFAPAIEIAGWCAADAGPSEQPSGPTPSKPPLQRGRSFVAPASAGARCCRSLGADGGGPLAACVMARHPAPDGARNQDGAARSRVRPRLESVVGVGFGALAGGARSCR